MPFNPISATFARIWKFVDHKAAGQDITRSDLDIALDDIAGGLSVALNGALNYVGEWSAAGPFPTTRPDASAIQANDAWVVTAAGTVDGIDFGIDEYLLAILPTPGATYAGNWLRIPNITTPAMAELVAQVEADADRAEAAAAVVGSITDPVLQTFTITAAADGRGPYALDYDTGTASAVALTVNGLAQSAIDHFAVVDMPAAASGKGILFLEDQREGDRVDMIYGIVQGYDPAVDVAHDFPDVAAFTAAIGTGLTLANGRSVTAGGVRYVAETGAALDDIPAGYRPANYVYTRAEIEAATFDIAPGVNCILVEENGFVLPFLRVALATDLIGGDLSTWQKAGISVTDALALGTDVANSLPFALKIQSANIQTRAEFVTYQSTRTFLEGAWVQVEGRIYVFDDSTTTIADLPGWKPVGPVYAEHFGFRASDYGTTTYAAANSTALIAALAYCQPLKLIVNIGEGNFYFNGPIATTTAYFTIKGTGERTTHLYETTVNNSAFTFAPAGALTGNTLGYVTIENLSLSKWNNGTTTDGWAIDLELVYQANLRNLTIYGFVKGIRQGGGQEITYSNILIDGVWGRSPVANSMLMLFEPVQLDDLSWRETWTTHLDNIIYRATTAVEYSIYFENSDGIKFNNCQIGFGSEGNIKIAPTTGGGIHALAFTNCYFDGVFGYAAVPYAIHVADFTPGSSAPADNLMIADSMFGGHTHGSMLVEGPLSVRISNTRLSGWIVDPSALTGTELVKIDHVDASMTAIGCTFTGAKSGIFAANADTLIVTGCQFDDVNYSGNAAIKLGTSVGSAIVSASHFAPQNSATDLIDTATGSRAYTGNISTVSNSVLMNRGTWTPVLSFGGTNATMTHSDSYWRKCDDMIDWHTTISWTAKVGTGTMLITGLPFPTTVHISYPGSIYPSGIASAMSGNPIYVSVRETTPNIRLAYINAGATTTLTDVDFASSGTIHLSGTYRMA